MVEECYWETVKVWVKQKVTRKEKKYHRVNQKVTSKQNKSQRVKQKEHILPEIPLGDEEWNILSNHCLVKAENMEIELEEVKLNFNHVQDENEQNKKKIRDLKNYIQNVKDTNEELVDELERK